MPVGHTSVPSSRFQTNSRPIRFLLDGNLYEFALPMLLHGNSSQYFYNTIKSFNVSFEKMEIQTNASKKELSRQSGEGEEKELHIM